MASLSGKRALVTGGSRGIGAAIAKRLAADGADVAVTYERSAEAAQAVARDIEAGGRKALAIKADSRDAKAIEAAVEETAQKLGGLDILVNNAGVFRVGPVDELSVEDFDATLAVNLRAAFVATKAALKHLKSGGRIISIGSTFGVRAPFPGLAAYSASKAGIVGLTQGLARDVGPRGITANVVQPGSTETDMNPVDGPSSSDQLALAAKKSYSQPSEIASVVAYLASDAAASVTGAAWTIDNGVNA